jgi:hypothetical protein
MIEYHVIGKVLEEKIQIKTAMYSYFGYPQSEPIIKIIYLPCKNISKCIDICNSDIVIHEKVNIFKEYKECFVIISEREFRDNETLTCNGVDYKILYKYNEDEKQHQLYIDYEVEIIKLDEEFIIKCENNYNSLMEFRKNYIEKQKQEVKNNDEIKNESKNIIDKLKSIVKRLY